MDRDALRRRGAHEALLQRFERGEIDANPGVFRTAAREPTMDFTSPTAWESKKPSTAIAGGWESRTRSPPNA